MFEGRFIQSSWESDLVPVVVCRIVRGPGIFGKLTVSWNITPPKKKEFAEISGTLTMKDRQSAAVVLIQV